MNWINEYYQKLKDGTIACGRWILLWYKYIIQGIENGSFFFDGKKAQKAIVFIENFCRHSEGSLGGKKIKLEIWQKALVSVIFGVVDKDGNRQFREIFVVIARKNGKTLLAAAIAAYCTYLDGEYGARIYFSAPKLEQANLCFNAFWQIIQTESRLNEITKKRRTDVFVPETNSFAKPIAFSEKKSDGLNVSLGVCDEVAAWSGDQGLKFYEVLKSSQGSRRQPLLLSITTAGYVNEGVYDELMRRATRVLLGDSKETRLAPFLYMVDDVNKWNDINELAKANPNLSVSVTVDYLLDEIAVAEGSLSKKAEFLTKYCNIKQNSSTAWLSTQAVEKACQKHVDFEDFKRCYGVIGIDLSRTTDLTSAVLLVEKDGIINAIAHFWLPTEKIEEATARDGIPYNIYIQKGFLSPSGENFVDYNDCLKWCCDILSKYSIYPLQVGYDRYCANYLIESMKSRGFHCDDVFQGTNLTPVIREAEGLFKDGKINIGDNDLLKIHLLNAALKQETETERVKMVKIAKNDHIDGAAAFIDALCVRQKWWGQIGAQLLNQRKD